jgi:hypothetical protein
MNTQERLVAMTACIPFLFWIPILLEKKTEYTSYFMKHGFGLTVIGILLSLIMSVFGFIAFLLFPLIWFLNIAITLCAIYLGYNAFMGKKIAIPYYTENLEKILIQLGIISWFTPTK